METLSICLTLLSLASIECCLAEMISSPGLQRIGPGGTCIFRWTVGSPIDGFQINNLTAGSPSPLRRNTSTTHDASNGVIVLTVWNVQLWDAGNYSLTIKGPTPSVDTSACLFIYDPTWITIYENVGALPITEGDNIELICNITSYSLPAAYRPKIYYFWVIWGKGKLKNISSGPAVFSNGELLPRHSIKNDGRTLAIDNVKYPDDWTYQCQGSEDGSPFNSSRRYPLLINHKPYPSHFIPFSQRIAAINGTNVLLSFVFDASPTTTCTTNWTFVDAAGRPKALPASTKQYCSYTYSSLRFNFSSEIYYGTYSILLTNSVGSTAVQFHVLPAGPPDVPSNLRLFYISDSAISINFNAMFSNCINYQQTVFARLTSHGTGLIIETQAINFLYDIYNLTRNVLFQEHIQPKSNYEIRVWSINVFGRSEMVTLSVRTRSRPTLNVSSETISINGNHATINFTLMGVDTENITGVNATCCSSQNGICVFSMIYENVNQIVMIDIPWGKDYLFNLTVFCGVYRSYSYVSAMGGVKASRNAAEVGYPFEENEYVPIVFIIVAACIGVVVLVLIVILISHLYKKYRAKNEVFELPNRNPSS